MAALRDTSLRERADTSLRERAQAGERLLGVLLRMPAEELVEMVCVAGHDFVLIDCEHGPADVLALRDAALQRFGGIDVLMNNAGVNPIYRGIERTSLADWQGIVDVNLTGVFLCCKHLGTVMAERGRGAIISISSVAGHVGLRRSVPYCAAKGGVELLTKALALDWAGKGVRVNCIAPGYFETDLTAGMRDNEAMASGLLARTPLGRFGIDADIAGAAVFLASAAGAYVTGQSLVVDGGYTAE